MFIDKFRDKNILLFTHLDLDGVSCYLIYKTYIEDIAKSSIIEICDREDIADYKFDKLQNVDIILFTDISPVTLEQYNDLIKNYNVIIIDHHKSARDFLGENLIDYYYSEYSCGAKLFFDLIRKRVRVKKVVVQFIELVNIFDLYQTDSILWKDAKGLSNVLYGYVNWAIQSTQTGYEKYGNFIKAQYEKFMGASRFFFSVYEQGLVKKAEEKERSYFNEAKRIMQIRKDSLGNTYGYTEARSKVSWVAHLLLRDNMNLDYLVIRSTFNDRNGNIIPKVSVRSNEDKNVDCAIISERFGGGGHKFAAGIEFKDIKFFEDFRKGKKHLI